MIVAIKEEFPELPVKRFVLEDRPETIEAVEREGVKGLEGVCPFFALLLISILIWFLLLSQFCLFGTLDRVTDTKTAPWCT